MAQGRWYPTTTTLPNGEVLVLAGEDEAGVVVTVPEIWNGTAWRRLTTASQSLLNYPRTFVAPDGRVFYAGAGKVSRWLNVSGTGSWSTGPSQNFGPRNYGSAVMYRPGKILFVGRRQPPAQHRRGHRPEPGEPQVVLHRRRWPTPAGTTTPRCSRPATCW